MGSIISTAENSANIARQTYQSALEAANTASPSTPVPDGVHTLLRFTRMQIQTYERTIDEIVSHFDAFRHQMVIPFFGTL